MSSFDRFINSPSFHLGLGILSSNRYGDEWGRAVGEGGLLGLEAHRRNQELKSLQNHRLAQQRAAQQAATAKQQALAQRRAYIAQNYPDLTGAPETVQDAEIKRRMNPSAPSTTNCMQWTGQGWEKIPGCEQAPLIGAPETGGLDFSNEAALRKEYAAATKKYWPARASFERIQASVTDPSAAGDLATIFNYMKMLDPGSTVREKESASVQNAGGVPQRIRAVYNSLINGQKLTPEQRADFVKRAEMLFAKQHEAFLKDNEYYSGLAESYNFLPERIIRDMPALSAPEQPEPEGPGPEPDEVRVIDGVRYYRFGTEWKTE